MSMTEPSEQENGIGKAIVDAAYRVHKQLGPGLLENIYEICFCHELTKKGLLVERQFSLPIMYDGILFEEGLRIDVFVDRLVICELKAVQELHPVFTAQLLSQLKLADKRLGFLLNFNVPIMKQGIKRIVRS